MICDGNMADLSLLFRLERRVVQSVLSARLWTESRIVELINVNVIGLQRTQTRLKVLPKNIGSRACADKTVIP